MKKLFISFLCFLNLGLLSLSSLSAATLSAEYRQAIANLQESNRGDDSVIDDIADQDETLNSNN